MLVRGVAPSAIGAVGAEVRGRHYHRGSSKAVARARGVAGQLEARPAAKPGVEQGGAQSGCVGAVACAVEVSKSTSTTCIKSSNRNLGQLNARSHILATHNSTLEGYRQRVVVLCNALQCNLVLNTLVEHRDCQT